MGLAGDEMSRVAGLRALGRQQLAQGARALALRTFREAAAIAAGLGEGLLGRALGDLGVALAAVGEYVLADRTLLDALAHLHRATDPEGIAEVVAKRAQVIAGDPAATPAAIEAAWADAARQCAMAGMLEEEMRVYAAAARAALHRHDRARCGAWLEKLAPYLDQLEGAEATWACGELGAWRLVEGRPQDAVELLARAAREEGRAGNTQAATLRRHELQLCLALLGQPT
jgi:hypothetical protein